MSISSEQYKTAIFEMCRRTFRVDKENLRITYFDMVYKVLEHESVIVTAEGYDSFCKALEGYLNYCSDSNLLTAQSIYQDSNCVSKVHEYLRPAFAGIGITMTFSKPESGQAKFVFVYPDGSEETYILTDDSGVELNIRFYSTLDYAKRIMPYWDTQPSEETIPLNELHRLRGSFVTNWDGDGVYWSFDKETKTIEFTGTGTLIMPPSNFIGTTNKDSVNIGEVLVAIYGAGVTSLPLYAFDWGSAGTTCTIVCLHSASDAVTLNGSLALTGSSSKLYTLEIYCDNEAIRAGTFGQYVNVNWHPLSEWAG